MNNLKEDLKNKKIEKAYLFCGQEIYLRDKYVNAVVNMTVPDGEDDINYTCITGDTVDLSDINEAVSTIPFFAEKRIVVVKDSNIFAGGKANKDEEKAKNRNDKKKKAEDFGNIIDNMPESSVLLFVETNVAKTNALYKTALKKIKVVEFGIPSDKDLINMVNSLFKEKGISISLQNTEYFVSIVEHNMSFINNEIEKISAYVFEKKKVEKDDIDIICNKTAEARVFDLIDKMINKDTKGALKIYQNMLANKESAIMVLVMISRQFRNIFRCRTLAKSGCDVSEIAKLTELKEYPVKKCLAQGRNFEKLSELTKALKDCADFDIKIKKGLIKEEAAVEMLILKYSK